MKPLAVSALILLVTAVAGCAGYSAQSPHPADVRTVAVPIFQSREFRRGLEFELTEELIKMIQLRTPYTVTAQERADTVITGTIQDLSESVLTEDDRDNPSGIQVSLAVDYQWKDLRTGRVIRAGAPRQSWYYAVGEHQTLRSAQTTAIRRLAERIVEDMEKDW